MLFCASAPEAWAFDVDTSIEMVMVSGAPLTVPMPCVVMVPAPGVAERAPGEPAVRMAAGGELTPAGGELPVAGRLVGVEFRF